MMMVRFLWVFLPSMRVVKGIEGKIILMSAYWYWDAIKAQLKEPGFM